jgi:hypothetical protein
VKYLKLYEKYKFDKQALILEKNIEVGDNLMSKLNKINSPLSRKIKSFLQSGDIKDDLKIKKIDFDDEDNKVFTLIDDKGQERKFKFGKLLKYLGYKELDDIKGYEVENFVSNFKKSDVSNLELRKGEDILKSYLCDNYDDSKGHGNLFHSCMRFSKAQKYLDIYTKNPEQVACLTLVNPKNKRVQGRALIWKQDNGKYFMDRIYVVNKELESVFKKYAHDNDIELSPSDKVTLSVKGEYDYYPYMDTLSYYTPDTGVLSHRDGEHHLTSTTGGGGSGNLVWSDYMGEEIESDEAVYSHRLETYIYRHDAVEIFSWHGGPETPTTDWYPDNEDVQEISFKSDKFSAFDKAHTDDLLSLENDESKYVLEEDTEIYEDGGWGVFLKGDKFDMIDFDAEEIDLFAIEVTWKDSSAYEEYAPYEECCSAWNKDENDFVIMLSDELDDDYDEEDYYETFPYNTHKMTETVYIPESFFNFKKSKDVYVEDDIESIKDDAPFYIDLVWRDFYIKGNQKDIKLHKGIYLPEDLANSKCINLETGYRLMPSMSRTNYDTYDAYIKSIRKSIADAKRNGKDSKNYLPEHKYFINAFEKGEYLEKNLLRVIEDKTSYAFDEFRNPFFIDNRHNNESILCAKLRFFINDNNSKKTGAFPFSNDVNEDLKYVSWFSHYKKDNILIFPYVYSPNEDKYVVYRGDSTEGGYRLYTANEIMNLVQYGAI